MKPFIFKSELWLSQYVEKKVNTLSDFIKALEEVDDDTLYYHLYRSLFEYHFLAADYSNNFAHWLAENGFFALAEKISAIDLMECLCLSDLRRMIIGILKERKGDLDRRCTPFYFIKAVRMVVDTGIKAYDVKEFRKGIRKVGLHSLFYHLITSRLIHKRSVNDFSLWLKEIGEEEKADKINRMDIATYDLYEVRIRILSILGE